MRIFEGFQKGVNLGGWISQFAKYDKNHFDTFITKEDIKTIAGLGFDHVRVPVDYIVLEDEEGNDREDGYAYLESCREWCEEFGLHMIIDLHECYGYSFDPLKTDMDRGKFFRDEALQARFMKLWEKIATRFKDYPDQVAYEPLNEVVLYEVADAWNAIVTRYLEMMRRIVPKSYIVIGGVCYNSVTTVPLLDIPLDDHIVYNFHCYEPMIFTHQGAHWVAEMPLDFRIDYPKTLQEYRDTSDKLEGNLAGAVYTEGISEIGEGFFEDIFAPAIAKAEKENIPLYCGEYGVIELADPESRLNWMRDIHAVFKKHGIGRALWNYKKMDFGFQDESFAGIRDRFMEIL
ncbi:MAG: glycoside hydrolase family 5 protein [Lachnospiraceae bacterium]|nr:glycoside hydrolase family 5 protein [Lachnospiraceae bacterium]